MKTKSTTSRTPPKNKINPQKNKNNNTNSLKKFHTQPQKGNGNKDKTKSDKKKNIGQKIKETAVKISKITIPLGAAILLFKNREAISENLKPVMEYIGQILDEFEKNEAVRRHVKKLAINTYDQRTALGKRKYGEEREKDPDYIRIRQITEDNEWGKFQQNPEKYLNEIKNYKY